jgi:hypothetical protein
LSSAILYAAIVVIWACVLIPRWLKRDASQTSKSSPDLTNEQPTAEAGPVVTETVVTETVVAETVVVETVVAETVVVETDTAADDSAPATPETHTDNHARMLSARRRMLLILCTLTVAAVGIAGIHLAAWWVAVPPFLMLGGYVLLLREARKADAEHASMEAAYRAEERHRAAQEAEAAREAEEARIAAAEAAESARIIDISGRRVRDELYDQYADEKRRAVGD